MSRLPRIRSTPECSRASITQNGRSEDVAVAARAPSQDRVTEAQGAALLRRAVQRLVVLRGVERLRLDGSLDARVSTLFSGDTLFAGSVGGIFADVSTYDDLLASIRFKLFALDNETVVMPGHGPPTTIAQEKAHNPFF